MKLFFLDLKFFCENHPLTRHIKYQVINFAPINKSIMANKILLTIECPKLAKMAIFKPHNFTKNDYR